MSSQLIANAGFEVQVTPEYTSQGVGMPHRFIVTVEARQTSSQAPPVNGVDTVFLLDKSGSMSGTPLALLKEGATIAIQDKSFTPKTARMGVVSFSDAATVDHRVDYASTAVKVALTQAVSKIHVEGGTNIFDSVWDSIDVFNPVSKTPVSDPAVAVSDVHFKGVHSTRVSMLASRGGACGRSGVMGGGKGGRKGGRKRERGSTDAPADASTDAPADASTDAPADASTDAPTAKGRGKRARVANSNATAAASDETKLSAAVEEYAASTRLKNILFFSDGGHCGSSKVSREDLLKQAIKHDVSIHSVGIGSGHDAKLMADLARETGGLYVGINDNEHIAPAMAAIIDFQQSLLTRDLVVSVRVPARLLALGAYFDRDECCSPFQARFASGDADADSDGGSSSSRPTEITVSVGKICRGEKREFLCALIVPEQQTTENPMTDQVVQFEVQPSIRCTDLLTGAVISASFVGPAVELNMSPIDCGKLSLQTAFCMPSLRVIACSAMAQALVAAENTRVALLAAAEERLRRGFGEFVGGRYGVKTNVAREDFELLMADFNEARSGLSGDIRGDTPFKYAGSNISTFFSMANCMATQSSGLYCATSSKKCTSMDEYRSASSLVRCESYADRKIVLRTRCTRLPIPTGRSKRAKRFSARF